MTTRNEVPEFKAKVLCLPDNPNAFDLVQAIDGPYDKVARSQALAWELFYILNKTDFSAIPDPDEVLFMLELSTNVLYTLLDDVLGDLEIYLKDVPVPGTMFEVGQRSFPYVIPLSKTTTE
jgi:hypothetical protein